MRCADCGVEGGASLKICKSCMLVKYCNPTCQRNHWPKHKKPCKQRAAELRDEALFKDPPPKEDCPICFLPMPAELICCISLQPATTLSVPIYDLVIDNEGLAEKDMKIFYSCCGKYICNGCIYSLIQSGHAMTCPYCKEEHHVKTDEDVVKEMMKRVEVNDACAIYVLGTYYYHGDRGLQQDLAMAMKLWKQAVELGSSDAHHYLGILYDKGGDLKKAKFHWEAAAMAGHEVARFNLACSENDSGNVERAVKHCIIAASAGYYKAMNTLNGVVGIGTESIDSTLMAYNNTCADMRSEARDAFIRIEYL